MTEPPIAAIQKKSISKPSLKSDGRFYMPIFRLFGTLEKEKRYARSGEFRRDRRTTFPLKMVGTSTDFLA
jgi:hypothetical protein